MKKVHHRWRIYLNPVKTKDEKMRKGHLEDLDPELPFLESRLSLATVGVDGCCSSSSTFFLISSLFSDGTGLSELVGVWVRDAFLDDFLVSGD